MLFVVISTRPRASALMLLAALLAQGLACSQETREFNGSSGGSGGAGGGGGSGELVEDCLNGDDDDQDGKRDCDDEDCAPDFECVAPAPEGWIGPVALFKGPSSEAPACPTELPDSIYQGLADLVDEPAQCSACSCDPTGVNVNCSLASVEAYAQPNCAGSKNQTGQNNFLNGCSSKSVGDFPESFRIMPPQVNAFGLCMPAQAEASLPPPVWASIALACSRAQLGKGCGTQLCAPRGKPPFEEALCIVQKGDHECPVPFLTRHTFADDPNDVTDARGCGPCQCGQPEGSCSVLTTLYSTSGCDGMSVTVPNDSSCVPGLGFEVKSLLPETTKTASCAPEGGAPMGSITPANTAITTVCCAP